jgi:hypothetical protein
MGFGSEGRIPSWAVRSYAADYGIHDLSDLRWFVGLIRAMDSEYLEIRRPKDKDAPKREVRMSDHKGIRDLIHSAAARRNRDGEDETQPKTTFLIWSRSIQERY